MSRDIRINEEGAGEWIMSQLGGHFTPKWDMSFSSHDADGRILGGFVLNHYIHGSMACHMAAQDPRWCSRDLLWLIFHYAFEQLGVHKMLAPLPSNEHRTIAMNLRGGWQLETTVANAFGPGIHMLILGMTKETCKWLNHTPTVWVPRKAA